MGKGEKKEKTCSESLYRAYALKRITYDSCTTDGLNKRIK